MTNSFELIAVSALLITGRSGAGKTSIANTVASRVQADSGCMHVSPFSRCPPPLIHLALAHTDPHQILDRLYIDLARYTETPVQTLKALFKYWWAVVAWHRPSVLVLDNVDKLMGVELEVRYPIPLHSPPSITSYSQLKADKLMPPTACRLLPYTASH